MRESIVQGPLGRCDDVGRGIEIWFTDLKMDDVAAFAFQGLGARQD